MHMSDSAFGDARAVLVSGLETRAFPAAVVNVGRSTGALWQEAFGRLTYAESAAPCELETVFDLASLTKVIATASVAMRQIEHGLITLDMPVGAVFPAWRNGDKGDVVVRHLLDHSSGLPAHARLYEHTSGREAYLRAITAIPLERMPGTASVYSDPGFIVLGLLLEATSKAALDLQFASIVRGWPGMLQYRPDESIRDRIAPTEIDSWRGRELQGEVHDENAAALGGVAAHAGLFGTAEAVGAFARMVLATFNTPTPLGLPATMKLFATRTGVAQSSRALAWDTALPTSSCGTRMSSAAIGHTGFTGTSLWIDWERDFYVVLLTNRVHPTRENNAIRQFRPRFHDTVAAAF